MKQAEPRIKNKAPWSPCLHQRFSLVGCNDVSCLLLFWPPRVTFSLAGLAFKKSCSPNLLKLYIYPKISCQVSWAHKSSKFRFQFLLWPSFMLVLSFGFSLFHIHSPDCQLCSSLLLNRTIFNITNVAFFTWYELEVSFSTCSSPLWDIQKWASPMQLSLITLYLNQH